VDFLNSLADTADAYLCLGNLDLVRQLVNLAAVSIHCVEFRISESTYELFYVRVAALLVAVDSSTETTEVYLDNRLKSLFLLSSITDNFGSQALTTMLNMADTLSLKAKDLGFLRADSSATMLMGLSNFIQSELSSDDV